MKVKVSTVRFLEDDVFEGSISHECYENAREDVYDVDNVEEAVRIIKGLGLSYAATNNDWAANPDGSVIVNYATGEREEVTAWLIDETDEESDAVVSLVG